MSRDFHMEVNFQEAVREYYRAYAKKELGNELVQLLEAQRGRGQEGLSAHSTEFE